VYGSHLITERLSVKHAQRTKVRREGFSVIGMDSETFEGEPITFQFFSLEAREIDGIVFIGEKDSAVHTFLKRLKKLRPGRYRMYGHNLEFDLLSVLWEVRAKIRDGNIDLDINGWKIVGRYSKPVFCTFSDGERYIELVDSILWFQTSLERAGKIVKPDLPKLRRPKGLGTTRYKRNDDNFVAYAMRDAEVAYYLGLAIEKFHEDLDIPSQISLASMAAAVFKRHYMRNDIYQPPLQEWMVGAAASYHGGVNRVRPGAAPAWHKPVTSLDFSSAYPRAMLELPDFKDADNFKPFRVRDMRHLDNIPELGIYEVSGRAAPCDWPALFDHNFKPIEGTFNNIWVTGFELKQAIESDELIPRRIRGYYYDDDSDYSPFKSYSIDFYAKKSDKSLDYVTRYMYKILLNALTGKTIQTSPDYTLVDGQLVKINRAGGLYHPFAASLITGHTRANMHPMEHKYEAIHTATDGIFAPGINKGSTEKVLGAFVSEGTGDLALFRNKLYIFYTDISSDDTYESQVFEGRHVLKCARHGFQGKVADLEDMLVSGNRKYQVNKPVKLKTALRKGENPNKFVVTDRRLNMTEDFKVFQYGKTRQRAERV